MALTKEDLQAIAELMDTKLEPINKRLDTLETEMSKGFEKVHGDIGNLYENSDKNMKLINEGLGHLNERYAQLDKVEKTVDDHDNRIYAIEQKIVNG